MSDRVALTSAADALVPEIAERAGEGDDLRTMPVDLVDKLRHAGLFRIAVPRSLGGHELDPVSIIEIIEKVSWADGSAGWTALIGNSTAFFAWLEPCVVAEMFGARRDIVSTGVFRSLGRAVRTSGDAFVLSGRWPFNSGCLHADWYQTGFLVMDGDAPALRPDGRPDWRFAYYPRHHAQVVDTWHTSGLRGTGSHDVVVDLLVIPEAHTAMPMFDRPRQSAPLFELGFSPFTGALLAGFPLGLARRALDELLQLAASKVRSGNEFTIADDRHAQHQIGRAEGAIRSARAFAIEAYGAAWESVLREGTSTQNQRNLMRLSCQQAMTAAITAVDIVCELAGSAAVYDEHPISRCARDLAVARQHVVFSGGIFAEYARLTAPTVAPTAPERHRPLP